eukprot:gene15764-21345_t
MNSLFLFLLLSLLNVIFLVEAKTMWGRRKPQKDDEMQMQAEIEDEDTANNAAAQFLARNSKKHASNYESTVSGSGSGALGKIGRLGNDLGGAGLEQLIETYLKMAEDLIESDDFQNLVSPESIRSIVEQIPGISENPQVSAVLNSPEFQDPILLRQQIQEGFSLIRQHVPELINYISNPEKLEELFDQLPSELRVIFDSLKSGDFSQIKTLIDTLPIDESQKTIINNLLDGNTDAIANEFTKVLGNKSQLEAARLNFLENPELAQSFGISEEVLKSPEKWAKLMEQGIEALANGGLQQQTQQAPRKRSSRINNRAA